MEKIVHGIQGHLQAWRQYIGILFSLWLWASLTLPFYLVIIKLRKILDTSAKRSAQLYEIADTFWRLETLFAAVLSGAFFALFTGGDATAAQIVVTSLIGALGFGMLVQLVILKPAGFGDDVDQHFWKGLLHIITSVSLFAGAFTLAASSRDPSKLNILITASTSFGPISTFIGLFTAIVSLLEILKKIRGKGPVNKA